MVDNEFIPIAGNTPMIGGSSIRKITMNRTLYLKTASTILNGKALRSNGPARPIFAQEIAGHAQSFQNGIANLGPSERGQLLTNLTLMLERERRRCKARAGRYDAGRHIGLYLAVKSLMKMDK